MANTNQNFFNKLVSKFARKNNLPSDFREIREVQQSENKNKKNFFVKLIGSIKMIQQHRGEIISPESECNFDDIYNAYMSDSYINVALNKYKSLVYKAGYQLKSENDRAIEYLNKRFKIFSLTTGKPMDILFQEISDDLVMYSNAFIVKKRSDDINVPNMKQVGIFGKKPVAGYFRIDPRDIRIELNNHGTIKRYIYNIGGDEQYFDPLDIIHIYMDKTADHKFGTPRIVAALEDVKLLRRIEGNIAVLIYRFAMPIYHWKVGLEDAGKGATETEINDLTAKVAGMDVDGCIVTNERTNVNSIGADGVALDASGYLSYFEKRVFSALGVSESQMGRGGAKQDADSMESQMHDYIKYIQRHLSVFIENYMLTELLLEGGFDPISNANDYVNYAFNEISLDTKIKLENHEMAKFQADLITFSEVRHELNKKAEDVDPNELYTNMITNKSAIDQINAKATAEIKVAKATAGLTSNTDNAATSNTNTKSAKSVSGVKGNGTQKSSKNSSNGTIKSINTPSNQHGKTSVKIKESADKENLNSLIDKYSNISLLYKNIKEASVINKSDLSFSLIISFNELLRNVDKIFAQKYSDGQKRFINEFNDDNDTDFNTSYLMINNYDQSLDTSAKDTIDTIKSTILNNYDGESEKTITETFDNEEYKVFYMLSYLGDKAYWNGYANAAKEFGIKELLVDFSEGSDDIKEHDGTIELSHYSIGEIPSYHAFCKCKLSYNKE